MRAGDEITRESKKARKAGGLAGSSSDDSGGSESDASENEESDYESSKNMSSGDDDDFNPFRDESSEDDEDGELIRAWRVNGRVVPLGAVGVRGSRCAGQRSPPAAGSSLTRGWS